MNANIFSLPTKTSKIPKESAGKLIFDKIKTFEEDSIALVEVNSGISCTYGQLVNNSVNLAASLRHLLKISKNDNLAIVSENSYKFWVAWLAAMYVASPIHLLNPGFTTYELKKFLMMSKPKLVFCSTKSILKIKSLKQECPFLQFVVLLDDEECGDVILYENLIKNEANFEFEFEKINDLEDQIAYIANSSGTTGFPKGTMITHENVRLNLIQSQDDNFCKLDCNIVFIIIIPFYHVYGLSVGYGGLYGGAQLIIMDQFAPKPYLASIQNHRVNKVLIVPTLGDFLANSPLLDDYDLSSVDEIISAAGILKPSTQKKILEKFNLKSVRQIYGLTETASAVFATPIGSTRSETCGKLIPGHSVKIVDPITSEPLGYNRSGEIRVKGTLMKGYIGDAASTRNAFDSDGFLRTGDVGYYDEEHYFYIIDRFKDLIKYKSFQVAPMEIEEVLLRYEGVKDAAVVGKMDERYGELPVAFVVKVEGAEIGEGEVVEHVAKFVCEEKRLHGGVRFVEEIPRNSVGKILRKDLRQLLQ